MTSTRERRQRARRHKQYRPNIECFEDRIVPTKLFMPTNLTAAPGTIVTVPINVDNLNPDNNTGGSGGLAGADFVLFYDTNVFSVVGEDVKVGALPASYTGWVANANATIAGKLFIGLVNSSGIVISDFAGGTLVTVDFHVKTGAAAGATAIDLAATNNGDLPSTAVADQSFQNYTLSPPPQDGFDANDGIVTINPAPPAAATHFSITGNPNTVTAGNSFSFTVTALDANNNTATGYTGTVHFTSSDGQAVLPPDATLTNGVGTFSVTFNTAGSQTLTVSDVNSQAIASASVSVSVLSGKIYNFSGFVGPLQDQKSFKIGSIIPIKFGITDLSGNPVTSLNAISSIQGQFTDEQGQSSLFPLSSKNGLGLRIMGKLFVFNWQTSGLQKGLYSIIVTLADGTTATQNLQLT